jgi:uncharacterized membrane protein
MTTGALFLAVFLACAVEAVEATTIVLAAGTARDWRSAAYGLGAALLALAVVVAALAPLLALIPLDPLRLVVGAMLLLFGLQWLRKAVLRAGGVRVRRDEALAYRSQLESARLAAVRRRGRVPDWYGFTLSFNGVLLEGMEVVFIVLTFGTTQNNLPVAAIAAICALLVVSSIGFAVRAPLARVPENSLKFVVGVMLTGFGTFWAAEGAGAQWPGSDTALLVLVPAYLVIGVLLAALLRHQMRRVRRTPNAGAITATAVEAN